MTSSLNVEGLVSSGVFRDQDVCPEGEKEDSLEQVLNSSQFHTCCCPSLKPPWSEAVMVVPKTSTVLHSNLTPRLSRKHTGLPSHSGQSWRSHTPWRPHPLWNRGLPPVPTHPPGRQGASTLRSSPRPTSLSNFPEGSVHLHVSFMPFFLHLWISSYMLFIHTRGLQKLWKMHILRKNTMRRFKGVSESLVFIVSLPP